MANGVRRVIAADEREVVEAVRAARSAGLRVRVSGSGGSKSSITAVPGVALELRPRVESVAVDGALATAPAPLTTGRLQSLLAPHGLVLPTVGEWKQATLAGALATGTHGGSARQGVMSTSLERLRIVGGDGRVAEVDRAHPDFAHAAVGLGAFGAVIEVTLRCAPRFSLELVTDAIPFDEYARDPVAQESRSEFHASVWVLDAGRVIRFAADRVVAPERAIPRRERFGRRTALAALVARRLGVSGAAFERVVRARAVGDGAEILSPLDVPPRIARFRNAANQVRRRGAAELAIEASRAGEALERLAAFFGRHRASLNNPIGLRMSAADSLSLSPCSGRDTLWADLFFDGSERFARELAELAAGLGARCHWGKGLAVDPQALRESYPAWEAFTAARRRFDPDEVFANAWTDRLGLTGAGAERGRGNHEPAAEVTEPGRTP